MKKLQSVVEIVHNNVQKVLINSLFFSPKNPYPALNISHDCRVFRVNDSWLETIRGFPKLLSFLIGYHKLFNDEGILSIGN